MGRSFNSLGSDSRFLLFGTGSPVVRLLFLKLALARRCPAPVPALSQMTF
jgi:hypothetical protein